MKACSGELPFSPLLVLRPPLNKHVAWWQSRGPPPLMSRSREEVADSLQIKPKTDESEINPRWLYRTEAKVDKVAIFLCRSIVNKCLIRFF